jgi:hypothetical protein
VRQGKVRQRRSASGERRAVSIPRRLEFVTDEETKGLSVGCSCTMNDSGLLWAYRLFQSKHHLKDTDGHKHSPIGFGYLRIRASTAKGFIMGGLLAHTQPARYDRLSISDMSRPQVAWFR